MSVPGFNERKCQQRNRVAAGRFGVNAAPMRFRGAAPKSTDGFTVFKSVGSLPQEVAGALKLINGQLPQGAEKLGPDDVYIHYLEAANSNFIGDRYMFLGQSTLQNIGKGGRLGVSFLNSHRSGGLSTPAELPFGQTFAGRYDEGFDEKRNPAMRAFLGVFMRRGLKPNGDGGPSTDDLDSMVRAGTLRDVSVGLMGGQCTCDICGHVVGYEQEAYDANGNRLCRHMAGTTYGMSTEEIAAQKKRDARNKKGVMTYTLHDSSLSEISAVYDGAVPGAGVRQVLGFARNGDLTREDVRAALQDAFNIYGPLLPFDLGEVVNINPADADFNPGVNMDPEELDGEDTSPEDETSTEPADIEETSPEVENADETSEDEEPEEEEDDPLDDSDEDMAPTPENMAKLQAKLRAANFQLSTAQQETRLAKVDKFKLSMKNKIAPAVRANFTALFVALQKGEATPEMLKLAVDNLPKATILDPVPADLNPMDPPKEKLDKSKAARKRSLLAATPAGRAVLAEKEKEATK